jgi:SSS family solute:Na+ symporter
MVFPALIVLPGMIAIALTDAGGSSGFTRPRRPDGTYDYDLVIPLMLVHYFPPGMLGLGLTALIASFTSGMAGDVTAFNAVWTCDIYQSWVRPTAYDRHLLWMG